MPLSALQRLPTPESFAALRAALADEDALLAACAHAPFGLLVMRAVRGPDGGITDFVYTYANAAIEALVGRALVGRCMRSAFPSVQAAGIVAEWAGVIASGEPYARELHYTRDGVDVWVQSTGIPLAGDRLAAWIVDVSAHRRALDDLAAVVAACRALGGGP